MARKTQVNKSERGITLLVALLTLLLVSAISLGLIAMSNTETNISPNFKNEQTAFFAAQAGAEEVRDRLRTGAANSLSPLPTVRPTDSAGKGVIYITNAIGTETVAPWNTTGTNYPDDEICKEVTCNTSGTPSGAGSPWYTSPTYSTAYAASPQAPWKWVRITLKASNAAGGPVHTDSVNGATDTNVVCWNGSNEVVGTGNTCPSSTYPVYLITTLAVTPSCPPGTTSFYCGSRRMVQYEVTQDKINLNLPGALTLDGTIGSGSNDNICNGGSTCNSGGAYITGNNPSSCSGLPGVPAIATADTTSTTNLTTDINSNIVGSGASPSVVNSSSSLLNLDTPAEVEALVSQMKTLAGSNVGSDCTTLNLGTSTSPSIAVVTNDPVSSGVSGGVS
jgi:Tfp pilus assembly protein PilV